MPQPKHSCPVKSFHKQTSCTPHFNNNLLIIIIKIGARSITISTNEILWQIIKKVYIIAYYTQEFFTVLNSLHYNNSNYSLFAQSNFQSCFSSCQSSFCTFCIYFNRLICQSSLCTFQSRFCPCDIYISTRFCCIR